MCWPAETAAGKISFFELALKVCKKKWAPPESSDEESDDEKETIGKESKHRSCVMRRLCQLDHTYCC